VPDLGDNHQLISGGGLSGTHVCAAAWDLPGFVVVLASRQAAAATIVLPKKLL
jgi:hypothetical protein